MKKFKEMQALSVEELKAMLDDLAREQFENRMKKAGYQLGDHSVFAKTRHQVSQIKTLLRQQELAAKANQ